MPENSLYSKSQREILKILHCSYSCKRIGISDFTRKVLLATLEIPYGSTISYGQLAKKIGLSGASRAVGKALHSNPWIIIIPCHRVVPSDFPRSIGGFKYGEALKRSLLHCEKVSTDRDY